MPNHTFTLNGEQVTVDVPGELGLLYVLRDLLGVTGPKYGCGVDVCKACTSHLNGDAFRPCVTPVAEVEGQDVTTIEGLADDDALHPVQQAWIELDVAQCGFCQPGQIMEAVALLRRTGNRPTDADIDAMENMCRCGTYAKIREAIKQAADDMGPGRGRGRGRGRGPADEAAAGSGAATTGGAEDGSTGGGAGDDGGGGATESSSPDDGDGGGLLDGDGDGGGLLGAAAAPGSTSEALPATGSGLGAAGLVAAAAAAVRRGRRAPEPARDEEPE